MKLIVGLGNPGDEYNNTRHNIGFMIIDSFAKKVGCKIEKNKFYGKYGVLKNNDDNIFLLKPQKYMNLSGEVIKAFSNYFNINSQDILVICDDVNLPFAKIKLKYKGSSGGHNGLANIEQNLGTEVYNRLRFGVSNDRNVELKDYVLGKLDESEMATIKANFDLTNNIISDFLILPFETVMSKYNIK